MCVIVGCVADSVFVPSVYVVGVVNVESVLAKLVSSDGSNCDGLIDVVLFVFELVDISVNDVVGVASVIVIPAV